MTWLMIIGGLALLLVGGELLVRGAVRVASQLGVSPLIIGLTLVGFGTSTPELVTSVQAAVNGSPGIAFGNIVGSSIANLLLILGASAMLTPIVVQSSALRRDAVLMVAVAMYSHFFRRCFHWGDWLASCSWPLWEHTSTSQFVRKRQQHPLMVPSMTRASQPRMQILHLFRRNLRQLCPSTACNVTDRFGDSRPWGILSRQWRCGPCSVGRHFRDRDWPHHSGSRHVDARIGDVPCRRRPARG
jgi:hypothetical protein